MHGCEIKEKSPLWRGFLLCLLKYIQGVMRIYYYNTVCQKQFNKLELIDPFIIEKMQTKLQLLRRDISTGIL